MARSATAVGGLVCLETGIGEDDDEAFAVLVGGGDGYMLLSNELGELGRGQRLGSCHCDGDQLYAQNYVE